MGGLASLWVVWLVCRWFVRDFASLRVVWLVCGLFSWFGRFVDGLGGFWVVSNFTASIINHSNFLYGSLLQNSNFRFST